MMIKYKLSFVAGTLQQVVHSFLILYGPIVGRCSRYCDNTSVICDHSLVRNRPDMGCLAFLHPLVGHSVGGTGLPQYGPSIVHFLHQRHQSQSPFILHIHNSIPVLQWLFDSDPSDAGLSTKVLLSLHIQVS